MTENKRFYWDWKTGRMKDTYSDFQATKDMRLIEQSINDACRSYEKEIAKLKEQNKAFLNILENQSYIIDRLESELLKHQLKEPIVFKKEDLEIMGKAIGYYTHGECPR